MKFLILNDKIIDLDAKESRSERILGCITTVLGLLILSLVFYMIILFSLDGTAISLSKSKYSCNNFEQQVEHSNTATLNYYATNINDNYNSVLISPICIQSSVYNYFCERDSQKPSLFEAFDNGYKSWSESGKLFDNPCFRTITTLGIDSPEALLGKLHDISEGYIDILGVDVDISENTIYSVFKMEYGIKDGIYCKKEDVIFVESGIQRKVTDTYSAVKLDLSNPKYSVYLVEGNMSDFTLTGFVEDDVNVIILPYIWQSSGSMNGFVSSLVEDEIKLNMFAQFGFGKDNHKNAETYDRGDKDVLFYTTEYSFALVDNETGLILAVGKNY